MGRNFQGLFSVRSAYKVALVLKNDGKMGSCSDGSNLRQFWRRLWSIQIPHKIRHFAWRAARDILPTKENLVTRKVLVEANVRNVVFLQNLFTIYFGSVRRLGIPGHIQPFSFVIIGSF